MDAIEHGTSWAHEIHDDHYGSHETYQMRGTVDEARVLPDGLVERAEVLARELARAPVRVDDACYELSLVGEGGTELPVVRREVHLLHLFVDLGLLLLGNTAEAHGCRGRGHRNCKETLPRSQK